MAKVSEVYMVFGLESSTFPEEVGNFSRVVTEEVDIVEGEVYPDQARLIFARTYEGEVSGDTLYIRGIANEEVLSISFRPGGLLEKVIARVFGKEYNNVSKVVVDTKYGRGYIDDEEVEADALVISGNVLTPVRAKVEIDEYGRAVVKGNLNNVVYEAKTIYVFP